MIDVPRWRLVGGCDIPCGNYTIRQPKLSEYFVATDNKFIGFDTYKLYLSFVLMDTAGLAQLVPDLFGDVPLEMVQNIPIYSLLQQLQLMPLLLPALQFFIKEKLVYNNVDNVIEIHSNDNVLCCIDDEILRDIRSVISIINFLGNSAEEEKPKFGNKAAYEIWLKISKGRKQTHKQKSDPNINIPNLIEAVSANHSTYNLFNIWGLTVYQLHDQFYRLNLDKQIDILGTRWAAYGEEQFDFAAWYRDQYK